MIRVLATVCVLTVVLLSSAMAQEGTIRFDRDIRPLLSDRCFQCHGPDEEHREAGLRLDLQDAVFAERDSGAAIVPQDAQNSQLWKRISSDDPDLQMPPPETGKPLTESEKQQIHAWISQGAEWTQHWSFVTPERPQLPDVQSASLRTPIDHFLLHTLQQKGLAFSQQADRATLIRRLSFDLRGLPPTPEEVQEFVDDSSDAAYEALVDRFLSSPHFGERMAVMWMDAARYGDTSVFHADGPRDMWGWRDRVVQAYNSNMPFDRFSTLQLAGDLVPDASVYDRVLGGFNRNNGTTDEGGAIAEEYRVEYVVDRVKTTSTVWLGLSFECAQCHDHKYDPISQKEYYQFYAYFNVSSDGGMQTRNGNAAPTLEVPDQEKLMLLPSVEEQLAAAREAADARRTAADGAWQAWLTQESAAAAADETPLLPAGETVLLSFEEADGKDVSNSVAGAPGGSISGKVNRVEGHNGRGLKLDGSSWVDLGDQGQFERTDAASWGGWVKLPKNGSGALVARMDDGNAYRGYDCLIAGGKIQPHIINTWPTNAIKVVTKKALAFEQWQHVMVTYDGSSKAAGVKIYVNGESWEWDAEQDRLTETILTDKPFFAGSRNPGSRLNGEIDEIRFYPRALTQEEVSQLAGSDPIRPLLRLAAEERTEAQRRQLFDYYLANVDAEYQQLAASVTELQQRAADLKKPMTTVMVMQNQDKPRDTFVLMRGQYNTPTDRLVTAGTPAVLPPPPEGASADRLGLAQWLFAPTHPLTSRVAVNRYWQMLFGRGLVTTPEDFGAQGDYPTHPELLDWLAVEFRESGWNIKHMLKLMVTSHVYRQSSRVTPELLQQDPENLLYGRSPRFRLQAEFLRDNALAVSGLLNMSLGGPGVKPYQPPGLWAEVGLGGNPKFTRDNGDKLYRRSLYTYWKRSAPPPNMQIFDAPTREKCVIQRARTNTPLQALVTLNDVQFVEAARQLAARMMQEGGNLPASLVDRGFELVVSRPAGSLESERLVGLFERSRAWYQKNAEAAQKLLSQGESPNPEGLDPATQAAWTIVASTILNMDETLTRN